MLDCEVQHATLRIGDFRLLPQQGFNRIYERFQVDVAREIVSESVDDHVSGHDAYREGDSHSLIESIELIEPELPEPVFDGSGVGLFFDPRMALHRNLDGPTHPEQPARILRIFQRLEQERLVERCVRIPCRKARREELEVKHTTQHVDAMLRVESLSKEEALEEGETYNSLYLCPDSTQAGLLSAGAVLEAVERVCVGDIERAICVVRPPGHHAESHCAMGFCLFANVAVAVAEARKRSLSNRTLIVDWDVHHGNGTQRMFDEDDTVLFFSVHRHDNGRFYPCRDYGGYQSHGVGPASGYSVNVPWDVKSGLKRDSIGAPGDPEYLEAFSKVLLPIARDFNPDLVVVSAGFDSAEGDPLGQCRVTPAGFYQLTEALLGLANGRLVLALEGGYNLDSISASMAACARAILGQDSPPVPEPRPVIPFYADTIETVRAHFAQFWPPLRKDGEGSKAPEIRVPAAALKGTIEEMEAALAQKALETGMQYEELHRKQQRLLFKVEEIPELLPVRARRELKQSFGSEFTDSGGPVVLPIVYIESAEQAVRNVSMAFQNFAHGVWLVNAGHAHSPSEAALASVTPTPQKTGLKTASGPAGKAGRAQITALAECFHAVREQFQNRWIGLALPQLPAAQCFKWIAANCPTADAVWIDEFPCKPADIVWESSKNSDGRELRQALRLEKWLSEAQPALKAVKKERDSARWQGSVFGSIAGRSQEHMHHEQDAEAMGEACQTILQYWASLANSACDVLVTEGLRGDHTCSAAKLRILSGAASVALHSCGTNAEASSLSCLEAVLVDTMLGSGQAHLTDLDASHIRPWLPDRTIS